MLMISSLVLSSTSDLTITFSRPVKSISFKKVNDYALRLLDSQAKREISDAINLSVIGTEDSDSGEV